MENHLDLLALSPYMTEHSQSGSAIRRMDEIAKKMVEKHGDAAVHNFTIGNPRVPPPKEYDDIMIDVIKDKTFFLPHGYASNIGDDPGRKAIAELFTKIQEVPIDYTNVMLTSGCAGAINTFLRATLSATDEVIIFSPFFLEYPFYIENYYGKPVYCETKFEEGWQINKERFIAALNGKTRVVIINSPQNPTGIIYSENTIKMISEECQKVMEKFGRPIWILSDDVYCRILRPGKKTHQIFKHYRYSAIAYSLSKDLSIPGERVGALILNPALPLCENYLKGFTMANEYLSIYPPNRLHMRAMPKLLQYTSDINKYTESQKFVVDTLKELGIEFVEPEGAFYIFPKIPDGIDEMAFCEEMVQNFIVVVPGSAFNKKGFYRLSFCKLPEDIKKGMEQFKIAYKTVCDKFLKK